METGDNGAHGTRAVKHARKENSQEPVLAIHQNLSMVERNVTANLVKLKFAIRIFLAQASLSHN